MRTVFWRNLIICGTVLLVTACSEPAIAPKKMEISHEVITHRVLFEGKGLSLEADEYQSLKVFAHAVPASAISFVYVNTDEKRSITVKRAKRIKAFLVKEGIDDSVIHLLKVKTDSRHVTTVILEYTQANAPKHCPDWSKSAYHNHGNADHSNFGCAYDADMAAQIADPQDYLYGHGTPTYDATRDSVSIQKYETGAAASVASGSGSAASSTTSSSGPSGGGGSTTSTTTTPQ